MGGAHRRGVHAVALEELAASGGRRGDGTVDRSGHVLASEALIRLLESIDVTPRLVVGHSNGAPVALRAALDYPDLIDGIVMIGGSVDPDLETTYWVHTIGDWRLAIGDWRD